MIAVQGRCFQSLFLSYRTDCRRVQRNCLQACSGCPSFFFLFTGNTFPSLPIYWSISSSIRLLFSTWDEISSNISVSRMACKVTAARRFFSSFIWAPSRLSSTSPALSRSSDVITGAIPSVPGACSSSLSCSSFYSLISSRGSPHSTSFSGTASSSPR